MTSLASVLSNDIRSSLETIASEQEVKVVVEPTSIVSFSRAKINDSNPRFMPERKVSDLIWHKKLETKLYRKLYGSHNRIVNNLSRYDVYVVDSIENHVTIGAKEIHSRLHVFTLLRENKFEYYRDTYLVPMREGRLDIGCMVGFNVANREERKPYTWWDTDNDILFTFDRMLANNLKMAFANSGVIDLSRPKKKKTEPNTASMKEAVNEEKARTVVHPTDEYVLEE